MPIKNKWIDCGCTKNPNHKYMKFQLKKPYYLLQKENLVAYAP